MKELVEVIAKALVENPDEVVVTESVKDDETVIELSVAPADMGKVIQTKLKSRLPERVSGFFISYRRITEWLII